MSWYNGKSINEVEFCNEFVQNRPLKCIGGKLYGIDGEIPDGEICHDISVMLTEFVTTGIARKVKSVLEALKLFCHSEPISVSENEIHLLNGILKTDGTWISEKLFCVNRLNVFYRSEMQNGNYYPDNFLRACLVSSENNTNKSKREHLKRILKKSLAVFPKSAAFVKPAKRTFHDPTLWNNSKSMEFIAFNNFNCRT